MTEQTQWSFARANLWTCYGEATGKLV